MADKIALANLKLTSNLFVLPLIKSYNRLEPNPRSNDIEAGVSMEVADPMWYLCRQWQFGEFQGEDAGTAYQASILGEQKKPGDIILANGKRIPYDLELPLETAIEREQLSKSIYLSTQLGKYFRKLLKKAGLKKYLKFALEAFPINQTNGQDDFEGNYFTKAVAGFEVDGYQIYESVLNFNYKNWYETHGDIANTDFDKLEDVGNALVNAFLRIYEQSLDNESAWVGEHLEYSFKMHSKVDSRRKKVLVADQFASGHLDWKDFDQEIISSRTGNDTLSDPIREVQTFIPTALKFSGMPHPRLWQMEDAVTDFGKIDASSTSLVNLLLAEYGLHYSNDWFILPYEMEVNTISDIEGIRVTDVFGMHFMIQPTIKDPEMNWQEFAFFHQTERNDGIRNESSFYLVPAVGKLQESEPIEQVNFMRDEMSNLVWAIEQIVPSENGQGRRVAKSVPSLGDFTPIDEESKIRYVLGNTVPKNWIPFVPVQKANANPSGLTEIMLQRARMPQGDPAQSKLLTEHQPTFLIEEQEIGKAGIIVKRNFQRTRWLNGKTLLWMGRKKQTGRGEGNAKLVFDQLLDIKR
ncbi:MAG: hypothetical protein AAGK97_02410 [Bacteroidota bacterium]